MSQLRRVLSEVPKARQALEPTISLSCFHVGQSKTLDKVRPKEMNARWIFVEQQHPIYKIYIVIC